MIEIVNPNRDPLMTEAIREAVQTCLGPEAASTVRCLPDGPAVIESEQQHTLAEGLVEQITLASKDSVLVIACHGDPGVRHARARGLKAMGIGETSMRAASAIADSFAVLSLTPEVVDAKHAQVQRYGLEDRCVSIEATGSASMLAVGEVKLDPYLTAMERATRAGAGAIVLGCAGMARIAPELQRHTHATVIEPTAVTCVLAAATHGLAANLWCSKSGISSQ